MNALVRSPITNFSQSGNDQYELFGRNADENRPIKGNHGRSRTFPKRRNGSTATHDMVDRYSFSYSRDRAKRRQVFLRSYKFSSVDALGKSKSRKLKKVVIKVRAVVVSLVSLMRIRSLRSCDCLSAICASSPTPVRKSS